MSTFLAHPRIGELALAGGYGGTWKSPRADILRTNDLSMQLLRYPDDCVKMMGAECVDMLRREAALTPLRVPSDPTMIWRWRWHLGAGFAPAMSCMFLCNSYMRLAESGKINTRERAALRQQIALAEQALGAYDELRAVRAADGGVVETVESTGEDVRAAAELIGTFIGTSATEPVTLTPDDMERVRAEIARRKGVRMRPGCGFLPGLPQEIMLMITEWAAAI